LKIGPLVYKALALNNMASQYLRDDCFNC